MNARQAGYLASRLFAIYLVFQAVPTFFRLFSTYLVKGTLYGTGDNPAAYLVSVALVPALMMVCAGIFWALAVPISRSLTLPAETAAPVATDRWEILAFTIVGALALSDAMVELARLLATVIPYRAPAFGGPDANFVADVWTYSLHGAFAAITAVVFLLTPRKVLRLVTALRGAGT